MFGHIGRVLSSEASETKNRRKGVRNKDAPAERSTEAKHYGTADEIDAIINGADVQ